MDQPYLLRYRTKQRRLKAGAHSDCHYDHARDMIMHAPSSSPAVLADSMRPLMTKKADVEKGEDQKDTWL
jgi:hypothetical protein